MALIRIVGNVTKQRHTVHNEIECFYSIFRSRGETYLQLDSYGSSERQGKNATQTIQLSRESAARLKRLIEEAFPDLG
jgi:hypothetical protein